MLPRLAIFKVLQGVNKRELLNNQDILDDVTQIILRQLNDAKAKNIVKQAVLDGKTQVYDLKLQAEKESLKQQLQKFKGFWHKLIKHFQNKIGFDKDEKYKYVSDDLYKNGIFDDNDNRIVNDVARKIKATDELDNTKIKKKNNMELK